MVNSDVILTCIAELSPEIDVSVAMNIQITDPDGRILNNSTPSMSGSSYISTTLVSLFGRKESGNYNCSASVSSSYPLLLESDTIYGTTYITVGMQD